jgi:hypothetical protein
VTGSPAGAGGRGGVTRFRFVQLYDVPRAPTAGVAAALVLGEGQWMKGRLLRGSSPRNLGWNLFELVVPSRLPSGLDWTSDMEMAALLDAHGAGRPVGQESAELGRRYNSPRTVLLRRRAEVPVPGDGLGFPQVAPFGVQMLFRGRRHTSLALSWAWRCAHHNCEVW